ncbi:hypothetical protein [Streptomyces sp. NPDC002853]
MTSTDDILNQIDNALYDAAVGPDAMRSRPTPEPRPQVWIAPVGTDVDGDGWEPIGHVTDIDVRPDEPETADRPRIALSWETRQLLIDRLVDNQGLSRMAARHAVRTVEQGRDHRYADLVRSEARAIVDETVQRIRDAVQPGLEAAAAAIRAFGEALKQATRGLRDGEWVDTNGDPVEPSEPPRPPLPRRDQRPAWQTPYGPPQRRR